MDKVQKYRAFTREPESMSVGELNQAVKDLREELYLKQLKIQELQDRYDALVGKTSY